LKYIQPKEYCELDIVGRPDIKEDLDKDYPLPIESNRFDAVICTDVLEHLEELHRTLRELVRISRKYIIISVPNAFMEVRRYIKRDKYTGDAGKAGYDIGYYTKFYGLPLRKPVDHHRWFFPIPKLKISSKAMPCVFDKKCAGGEINERLVLQRLLVCP